MQLSKRNIFFYFCIFGLLLFMGCNKNLNKNDYKTQLKTDAQVGFKNSLQNNYNQIDLFRGEIYKLTIVGTIPKKVHYVGTAMGIIAVTTIDTQYEINRLKKGEDIDKEIINEITSRKLLEVVSRNQLVLNNIYKVILTPLNEQLEKGKDINQQEQLVLNELIRLTNRLLEDYSIILNSENLTDNNLNVQLKSMEKSQNELLKLTIPKIIMKG